MPVSVTIELVERASEKMADVLGIGPSVPSAFGMTLCPFNNVTDTILYCQWQQSHNIRVHSRYDSNVRSCEFRTSRF